MIARPWLGAAVLALLLPAGVLQAAGRAGTTNMTFSDAHGTQVEYLAPSGRTFLWYPGNRVVLQGAWRRAPYRVGTTDLPGICFLYGGNTSNPATGTTGGQWECEPLATYRRGLVQAEQGDVFDLARATSPPFDLPRERTTLETLRAHLRSTRSLGL